MTYLDNAATTLRKPRAVPRALCRQYANAGRGGHFLSLSSSLKIEETRASLAEFFTIIDPSRIAFTHNTTDALNLAIHGALRRGDHIIISGMEHNSVARPVFYENLVNNVEFSIVPPDAAGKVSAESIAKELRENTRLIAITHASNITGTINPIEEIGVLARENNILFLVDCAQSAGVLPINVLDAHIDLLAFPGHKMLFGVQGTGGLYVREGIDLTPLKQGGTGSMSEDLFQPSFMPDLLETGTQNAPGIAALGEGIKFIQRNGLPAIRQHEELLTHYLLEALLNMNHVFVYGAKDAKAQVGVVGFNLITTDGKPLDCVEIANFLSAMHGIALRAGFHCAALAHKSMGTDEVGMLRASFSFFTRKKDVDKLINAIWKMKDSKHDYVY